MGAAGLRVDLHKVEGGSSRFARLVKHHSYLERGGSAGVEGPLWIGSGIQHIRTDGDIQRISNDNIFAVEVVNPIESHYIFLTRLNAVFTLNATASGKLVLYYMDATRREAFYRTFVPTKYTKHTLTTRDELEAELERIGAQGYSTEFDEFGVGISCIAVPILRSNGTLYGTVSIVASSSVVHDVGEQALAPMRALAHYVREELL